MCFMYKCVRLNIIFVYVVRVILVHCLVIYYNGDVSVSLYMSPCPLFSISYCP